MRRVGAVAVRLTESRDGEAIVDDVRGTADEASQGLRNQLGWMSVGATWESKDGGEAARDLPAEEIDRPR